MSTDQRTYHDFRSIKIDDDSFEKISKLIEGDFGIKMPESKKTMLQSRLQKRLRANNMESFDEYCQYLFSNSGRTNELVHMIDVVSTNKTDFFREIGHYDYMREVWLPSLNLDKTDKLRIWSAAASSGEEIYSAAIILEEFNKKNEFLNYSILGTDISHDILKKAVTAVYNEERAANIPENLKKEYFLRSKNREDKKVRIIKRLREKTKYMRLNLMDEEYNIDEMFDLIFCRNVLIYFNRSVQQDVVNKICRNLKPGGLLFLGHSESLMGMTVPLKQIKPTIFEKI